jgi:hypothetical protein
MGSKSELFLPSPAELEKRRTVVTETQDNLRELRNSNFIKAVIEDGLKEVVDELNRECQRYIQGQTYGIRVKLNEQLRELLTKNDYVKTHLHIKLAAMIPPSYQITVEDGGFVNLSWNKYKTETCNLL